MPLAAWVGGEISSAPTTGKRESIARRLMDLTRLSRTFGFARRPIAIGRSGSIACRTQLTVNGIPWWHAKLFNTCRSKMHVAPSRCWKRSQRGESSSPRRILCTCAAGGKQPMALILTRRTYRTFLVRGSRTVDIRFLVRVGGILKVLLCGYWEG